MSAEQRQRAGNPMGPANPQALNRYAYTQNNPLRWTDPSGHWTLSLGFSGSAGGILSGVVSVGIVLDGHGNNALYVTTTKLGFAYGASAGVGFGASVTGADTIDAVEGNGYVAGVNAPLNGRAPFGVDVDWTPTADAGGHVTNQGEGLSIGPGVGADLHFIQTDTKFVVRDIPGSVAGSPGVLRNFVNDRLNELERAMIEQASPSGVPFP